MLKPLLDLFYPEVCNACDSLLMTGESQICISCRFHLPQTGFHCIPDNAFARRFWGRIPLLGAASFYYFNKGEKVQKLVHSLKYLGQQHLGVELGRMYGLMLRDASPFSSADCIIPLPLDAGKKIKRGFNQSEVFADGLSESMEKPCRTDILLRARVSETQTRKNREERWMNVKDIFVVPDKIKSGIPHGAHFLLVDDVVTTGATLEAAATALLNLPGAKVSLATIAFAGHS